MLVKYVALWPIAGLLVYFALDHRLRRRRQFIGLLVALLVFVATLSPHLFWLHRTDFMPFKYARSVAQTLPSVVDVARGVASFLGMQAVRLLPLVAGAWFVLRRLPREEAGSPGAAQQPPAPEGARLFLLICAAARCCS
jgi:hypothetical protein